jgi:ATP-dependent exoDNAse (exonuclease V) beta subunit
MVSTFKSNYEVTANNHRYTVGDMKNLPSVTTVIGTINKFGLTQWSADQTISEIQTRLLAKLGEPVTEELINELTTARDAHKRASREAADAGTVVHTKAAEETLLPGTPTHEYIRRTLGGRIVDVELPVGSMKYQFGGTIDVVIEFPDETLGIIDWKSGKRGDYPDYAVQLGGYSIALAEQFDRVVSRLYVVQLDNNAVPTTHYTVANIQKARDAFLSILYTYRYINSGRTIWG